MSGATGSASKRARADPPVDEEEEEEEEAMETGDGSAAAGSGSGSPASPSEGVGEEEEEEEEEGAPDDGKSDKRKLTDLNRQVRALQKEKKAMNQDLTRYKLALANSNHALTRNSISIPDNAKVTAGVVDSTEQSGSRRAMVLCTAPVAETEIPRTEYPYRLDLTGLPDTSTIIKPTRFKKMIPHALMDYNRTSDRLFPHFEQRTPFTLTWKLVNRRDPAAKCTEKDLKPGVAAPKIFFILKLVYGDDGEEVTMDSLSSGSAQHLTKFSDPNIIGTAKEMLHNGCVTFYIKNLHVLSSMTKPLHRKFRFELHCVDEELKKHEHMHAHTFDFFSVSRIRLKEDAE